MAQAGNLATYLVTNSLLHPAFKDTPVRQNMSFGGTVDDPTTAYTIAYRTEALVVKLQTAAYEQAKRLIRLTKDVIEQLTTELLESPGEELEGDRIVEVINANITDFDERWVSEQPQEEEDTAQVRLSPYLSLTHACS